MTGNDGHREFREHFACARIRDNPFHCSRWPPSPQLGSNSFRCGEASFTPFRWRRADAFYSVVFSRNRARSTDSRIPGTVVGEEPPETLNGSRYRTSPAAIARIFRRIGAVGGGSLHQNQYLCKTINNIIITVLHNSLML